MSGDDWGLSMSGYVPSPSGSDWVEEPGYLVRRDCWVITWDAYAERVASHLLAEFGTTPETATDEQINTADRVVLLQANTAIDNRQTWQWYGSLYHRGAVLSPYALEEPWSTATVAQNGTMEPTQPVEPMQRQDAADSSATGAEMETIDEPEFRLDNGDTGYEIVKHPRSGDVHVARVNSLWRGPVCVGSVYTGLSDPLTQAERAELARVGLRDFGQQLESNGAFNLEDSSYAAGIDWSRQAFTFR